MAGLGRWAKMELPESEDTLLIRTDFSDEKGWCDLVQAACSSIGEYRAYVNCVSNREWEEVGPAEFLCCESYHDHSFIFLADQITIESEESLILCVELSQRSRRQFRVPPRCLWEVENNLSTANMDFDDFCDCVDEEGIFRGFGDDTNSANPTLREHFDSVYSDYVEGEFPERRERFAGACVALGCLVSDEEISEQDVIRYLGNPDLPLTKIREDYNAMTVSYTHLTLPTIYSV